MRPATNESRWRRISASSANVTLAGSASNNSVVGGSNAIAVTSDGSGGVIMGGTGGLSVYDNGTSDTIGAFGATVANVSLWAAAGRREPANCCSAGPMTSTPSWAGNIETVFGGSGANKCLDRQHRCRE